MKITKHFLKMFSQSKIHTLSRVINNHQQPLSNLYPTLPLSSLAIKRSPCLLRYSSLLSLFQLPDTFNQSSLKPHFPCNPP